MLNSNSAIAKNNSAIAEIEFSVCLNNSAMTKLNNFDNDRYRVICYMYTLMGSAVSPGAHDL